MLLPAGAVKERPGAHRFALRERSAGHTKYVLTLKLKAGMFHH